MDYQRQTNGWLTFFEHWWFLVVGLVVLITAKVITLFARLTGTPWIWFYGIGLAAATVGVTLIFYAKLPLYRQRRFFTFGSRALPEGRRAFYRWGYGCVIFAVALLLCLLLSRP